MTTAIEQVAMLVAIDIILHEAIGDDADGFNDLIDEAIDAVLEDADATA